MMSTLKQNIWLVIHFSSLVRFGVQAVAHLMNGGVVGNMGTVESLPLTQCMG